MKNSRTDIDNLFEQGVSDVSRAPRKMLTEEQIKAAAAASKSGAGIWLLSHAKEMLIGVVSFAAGCLVMIAVLHYTAPKPSGQQAGEDVVVDTLALPAESETVVVETLRATSLQNEDHSVPSSVNPTSNITSHTSHLQNPESKILSPKSKVQSPESRVQSLKSQVPSPESQEEPVVVKKTIVQRDTVVINETVIFKDTVYVP